MSASTIYVGSGAGNHTTSIQDAIDNYANDGDTVFVYSGTYFENVVVDKGINLIGENRDTTIIDGGAGFSDVVDVSANWVNITSFAITNGSYGIHISYSNNISIIDNIFSDTRYGINLEYSPHNILIDNTLLEVGIFIQGEDPNVWNTQSIDTSNTVNGKPVFYWKNQNGGTIPPGAGQVILANCTNVKIENQNISNGSVGIQLGFSKNNYIAKNIASLNNRYGIHLYFSENNTLTNNTAYLNNANGICIYNSHNNTVINNNVSNNNIIPFASNGILLEFSEYNTIAYNDVSSNGLEGIGLGSSSIGNTINNNNVSNTERGINLHSQCLNNRIINNNVSGNMYGIRIYASSHNNDIINNDVSNNMYGIYLAGSYNNNIYHNNLINNTIQAYDDTNNGNQWDNGYPSGGNYWSDFDEPGEGAYDDYQGPNQDDPASGDGIVDKGIIAGGGKNPYIIDPDSRDDYPLLSLFEYPFLYEGWNLISIPFIQPDTNLDKVLDPIKGSYDAVQWYNVSDILDHWKHNHTSKPSHLNDLDDIYHTMGFWIHITELGGILFEYFGVKPTENQTIILHPGWNHVGYPSQTNYNRTEGLNNLTFGSEIDAIWTYNAATQKWEGIGETDYFEIGRGYWIHSKVEKAWEVPL